MLELTTWAISGGMLTGTAIIGFHYASSDDFYEDCIVRTPHGHHNGNYESIRSAFRFTMSGLLALGLSVAAAGAHRAHQSDVEREAFLSSRPIFTGQSQRPPVLQVPSLPK